MSTASRKAAQAQRDAQRNDNHPTTPHPATAKQEAANAARQVPPNDTNHRTAAEITPEPVRENGTRAVYGTWKFHDSPADFQYMGRHGKIPADPIHVHARTNSSGQQITLLDDDKRQVGQFGVATKFWIGLDGQTEHASDLRKAARDAAKGESAASKLHPCRCGCGKQIKNLYAQGHDARHVSQLAETYRDAVKGDMEQGDLDKLAASLVLQLQDRERLVAKLERSMELIDEKAAKGSKASTDDEDESESDDDE